MKQRTDGLYQQNIFIRLDPETGRRIYKTVYAKSKKELEKKAAEVITNVENGTYADDKHLTLKIYAKTWLEVYKGNIAANTRNGYLNIINNQLGHCAHMRLKDITKLDLQRELNKLSGVSSKRKFRTTLNQILECAIDDGLIYKNVARRLDVPGQPQTNRRPLTELEEKAISKADLSLKERAFLSLLLYTGMRRGEVIALTRNAVNLNTGRITVFASIAYDGEKAVAKSPKSEAGNRTIDILSPLKPILQEYIATLDGLLLFPNSSGQYMSRTSLNRFWEGIYRKLNISVGGTYSYVTKKGKNYRTLQWNIEPLKGLTPHIFRHNYATMLYYAGVDLKDAVRLLGHADSKTTLDIYTHFYTHLDQEKSNSKSKLEDFLSSNIV